MCGDNTTRSEGLHDGSLLPELERKRKRRGVKVVESNIMERKHK